MAGPRIIPIVAALAFLIHAATTRAEDDCPVPSSDCVAVGGWNFSVALGAGDRTNPLAHSQDIPLVVIPQFSYYGKRVFVDDLDLGFTVADGQSNTLNLVASPGYDRVFFYRSDLQNILVGGLVSSGTGPSSGTLPNNPVGTTTGSNTETLPKEFPARARHITYLAGPEWTFKYLGISGQLDFLHEITDQNHGNEVRAALAIPLGELGGSWSTNIGVTWKSAAIVNYYYGSAGIYDAGAALNPFAKLGYTRPLSKKWKLTGFVEYERLGSAIADSPIIARRYVTTAFFGAAYEFHNK